MSAAATLRLFLLAVLAAVTLTVLLGNREPISLVIFGRVLPPQPVGVWVLAAGLAGGLVGLLWQLLPRPSRQSPAAAPPKSPRRERERPEISGGWETTGVADWSGPTPGGGSPDVDEDWNIETPPAAEGAVDPEGLQRRRRPRSEGSGGSAPSPSNRVNRNTVTESDDLDDEFDFSEVDSDATPTTAPTIDAPYRVVDSPLWTDDEEPDDDDATTGSPNR